MSEPGSKTRIPGWNDDPGRDDRALRAFLEAYDLRRYARPMQRLIESGLPTLATAPAPTAAPGAAGSVATAGSTSVAPATPSGESQAESGQILAQLNAIAEQVGAVAPAIPVTARAANPPRPARLIGRDRELALLAASLRSRGSRNINIVAIEGIGGVGKTALAAEAVARLAGSGDFPGGAVWVSVAGLTGHEGPDVWTHIGYELGLSQQLAPLSDLEARRAALRRALAERPLTLLALDDLEPDLDTNALFDTLVIEGHTVLLLTSRMALSSSRVLSIPLRPLPPPAAGDLFRDRLRRVDASRPNSADELYITPLVARMGGLPLALELVAAYAGGQHRGLDAVLRELREQDLDAAAFDDPLDPQRALVATFEQSWAILTSRQQQLFAGLALLPESSFPRAVTLALAAATEPPATESDLIALVNHALVEPLSDDRLQVHPLLREYAAQKLRALPELRQAGLGQVMASYWVAFAEEHPGYKGMDALAEENDGLMAALTWAHDHQRHETVLALTHAMRQYWWVRGRRDNARLALLWALEAARAMQDRTEERSALHGLAVLKANTGDLLGARVDYEEALDLAHLLGDRSAEQAELHSLAVLSEKMGDVAGARAGFEQALALARQLFDQSAEQAALHALAVLDANTGDLAGAQAGYEQALALARQLRNPAAEQLELHELAVLKAQMGAVADAHTGFEEALALARQLNDPSAEQVELYNLGVLLSQNGELERGRNMIEASLALSMHLGDPAAIGNCHQFLAQLDAQAGNREGAIAHYREALRRFEQVRSPYTEEVRRALGALGEGL